MRKQAENEENSNITGQPLPPLIVSKRIKNVKDARELLSKLISEFCKGNIESKQAKDLCYLLSVYISTYKQGCEEQSNDRFGFML